MEAKNMTYRELQCAVKKYKKNGRNVDVNLATTRPILEEVYNKLTASENNDEHFEPVDIHDIREFHRKKLDLFYETNKTELQKFGIFDLSPIIETTKQNRSVSVRINQDSKHTLFQLESVLRTFADLNCYECFKFQLVYPLHFDHGHHRRPFSPLD